jgi:hypothetical protein
MHASPKLARLLRRQGHPHEPVRLAGSARDGRQGDTPSHGQRGDHPGTARADQIIRPAAPDRNRSGCDILALAVFRLVAGAPRERGGFGPGGSALGPRQRPSSRSTSIA